MKKLTAAMLAFALLLCGCAKEEPAAQKGLSVVATVFPTYDFARAIAGDKADVKLLLTPGRESHSYEPSTGDVIDISESDIFIYTCESMEPWAARLVPELEGPRAVNASEGLTLEAHDGHGEHGGHGHEHELDPHIWTDPRLCLNIVDNILAAFVERDAPNAELYRANAAALKEELSALDAELRSVAEGAVVKKLYHGGRFSMNYFAKEYGLEFEAAYDSCSTDAEPSVGRICDMIDEMRAEGAKAVFYEELSNNSVAELIADETGAKPLLLHSCHNVSGDELRGGATYLSLMRQNAENLKEALE